MLNRNKANNPTKRFLSIIQGFFFRGYGEEVQKPVALSSCKKLLLDAFFEHIQRAYRIPGIAYVAVQEHGIYANAFGIKDEAGKLLTVDTPMFGGSLSEPVLAYAVHEMTKIGHIKLDDPVIKYLSYFKMRGADYWNITIRHLLTHTSGIDDYTLLNESSILGVDSLELTTRSIASQYPKWAASEKRFQRSHYNYDILADLIQKVMGMPFEKYVMKSVFQPLRMSTATFYKCEGVADSFVTHSFLDNSFRKNEIYPYTRTNGGSRGLHASINDLGKWIHHLLHDSMAVNEFLNPNPKGGKTRGAEFGWDYIPSSDAQNQHSKVSEFGGFSNTIILKPTGKIGVAILTNIANGFEPSQMGAIVADWLDDKGSLTLKIPIRLKMGVKLMETGRVVEALKTYRFYKKEHAEEYDFSEKSLLRLGTEILKQENSIAQAIEIYKFCNEEFPNSTEVYLHLAEAYLDNGDPATARSFIDKAIASPKRADNTDDYVKYLLGRIDILNRR